jgi:hypothetical protein
MSVTYDSVHSISPSISSKKSVYNIPVRKDNFTPKILRISLKLKEDTLNIRFGVVASNEASIYPSLVKEVVLMKEGVWKDNLKSGRENGGSEEGETSSEDTSDYFTFSTKLEFTHFRKPSGKLLCEFFSENGFEVYDSMMNKLDLSRVNTPGMMNFMVV